MDGENATSLRDRKANAESEVVGQRDAVARRPGRQCQSQLKLRALF